jgi:hypothetical protein
MVREFLETHDQGKRIKHPIKKNQYKPNKQYHVNDFREFQPGRKHLRKPGKQEFRDWQSFKAG